MRALKLFDAVGLLGWLRVLEPVDAWASFSASQLHVPRMGGALLPASQELDTIAQIMPQLIVALAVDLPFFILLMIFIASIGGHGCHRAADRCLWDDCRACAVPWISPAEPPAPDFPKSGDICNSSSTVFPDLTGSGRPVQGGDFWDGGSGPSTRSRDVPPHQTRYWHGMSAQAGAILVQAVVVATVVIGVFRIDAAAMTIGALSACTLLANRALMPVSVLMSLGFRLMQGIEAIAPVAPLMHARPEAAGDQHNAPGNLVRGKIDLHRVSPAISRRDAACLARGFALVPRRRAGRHHRQGGMREIDHVSGSWRGSWIQRMARSRSMTAISGTLIPCAFGEPSGTCRRIPNCLISPCTKT